MSNAKVYELKRTLCFVHALAAKTRSLVWKIYLNVVT